MFKKKVINFDIFDAVKNCRLLLLTIFFLLLFSASFAQQIEQLPKWPHEKSDLSHDPSVVFAKLPNGFRYALMENHKPKDRVSVHLDVCAGSMNESDKEQGIAHFLEHLLFCGSTHFKPGELVKYFQKIGMRFGTDANAHTGFFETVYDIILPDGSLKSIKEGLVVIKDYAKGALLLPSEIEKERGVILEEKRTRDSASYRTFVKTLKFELPDARISKRLPIGKEDTLKKVDRKAIKGFYDSMYRPENMILVMVGDFDVKKAALLIKKEFSSLSARAPKRPNINFGKIDHNGIKTFYHFEKEAGSTTTNIEVINKIERKPDSFAFQKRMLIKDMTDMIVQNRLDSLVSKADAPFTSASISSGIYLHRIEYAKITAQSSPENWDKSLSLLEKTLRKAIEFGFFESELQRVKKDFIAGLENAAKKAPTRNSTSLARQLIHSINNDLVFQSPEQEKDLFIPVIESVTTKDVHKAFIDTWSKNHRLVLVTGNADLTKTGTDPEELILAVFNKSKKSPVSKPVENKALSFPYLPKPDDMGEIIKRKDFPDLEIIQIDFKNGVRLNLKKTDFKADEVLAELRFGPGRKGEPENLPGIAYLSEEVINESGLGKLDKKQLEQTLAGKDTSVGFGISEDSFFLNGVTVKKEVPLLFQLLYAYMVDPGYREDAYFLTQKRFKQKLASLSHSIDGAMVLYGRRFLAGGDTRFGFPEYKAFKRITLEDIKSWIDPWLKHDRLEISVVGDFDVESVIKIVSNYFGTLPERSGIDLDLKRDMPNFPKKGSKQISVETKIQKALVVLAYPSEDMWNIHRTRRFAVLADVFSDRLRIRIREKLHASYSPFAYNHPSRAYLGFGVFQAFVHADPNKTDAVLNEVKIIASKLANNGVTDEELKRALKPSITSIKDMMKRNSYWLNTVLSGCRKHPQQLDWSRTIMKDYASVTAGELTSLAGKYLKASNAATIIIKPEGNQK